jgi:hypothetical protein
MEGKSLTMRTALSVHPNPSGFRSGRSGAIIGHARRHPQELRNAETAHRNIEAQIRKESVSRLALERLEVAKTMDEAMAAYGAAFETL